LLLEPLLQRHTRLNEPIQLAHARRCSNNRCVRRRLVIGSVLFALLALAATSCGARTGLLAPEVCPNEGAERVCQDGCGNGTQTCDDGLWSPCQVPVVTRGCSDGCAEGQESCVDGRWQACQAPLMQRDCASVCGPGHETCRAGVWGKCDAPQPKPPQLKTIVRDFSPATHPDFEASYPSGLDTGIVLATLGPDDKPVYAGMPSTQSTSGAPNFESWFHDSALNASESLDLQLLPSKEEPGLFSYDNHQFFPIDGKLLGNEGRAHNFHFTLEASTSFEYRGGELFSFSGDDDMWVFINRRLAIDLGGLHRSLSANVALDDFATAAGLVRGNVYPLHFFFAERHTIESNFTLRTSIADPGSCD
jgi:fibro-slime domain-containing protein